MNKPGRNDPCHCGSGKKYKKCCLLNEDIKRIVNYEYEVHLQFRRILTEKMEDVLLETLAVLDMGTAALTQCPLYDEAIEEWLIDSGDGNRVIKSMHKPFMLFGFQCFNEKFLWQYCLEDLSSLFNTEERAFLQEFYTAPLGFFQAKEIFSEEALIEVEDILTGRRYQVKDKGLSSCLVYHDIFSGFLIPFTDNTFVLEGATEYKIPPEEKAWLIDILTELALHEPKGKSRSKEQISANLRNYPELIFNLTIMYLYRVYNKPMPTLTTTDGDLMIFATLTYSHQNREIIKKGLLKFRDIRLDEETLASDHLVWLNKEDTVLGHIHLTNDDLQLETNSKRRASSWKSKIKSLPMKYIKTSEKTVAEMMKEHENIPPSASQSEDIPEDVLKELAQQFWGKYYNTWPNESLPALDGLTPKQAVKSKDGRQAVSDLIDEFENTNMSAAKNQNPNDITRYFDADILRQRVGLL